MSETEEFAAGARLNRRIVEDLIRQARALRDKAERLEKESDRLRAAAARELADYLEGAAAEWLG